MSLLNAPLFKSQSNPGQGEQSRRHQNAKVQVILLSCCAKTSMVLLQKQTSRPAEQNKRFRNHPRHIQGFDRGTKNTHRGQTMSLINGSGKMASKGRKWYLDLPLSPCKK